MVGIDPGNIGMAGSQGHARRAIDHLVYAVPDLDVGIEQTRATLGVRPVRGGRHPAWGTHNAVLALGPATYLEVIARDPGLPVPEEGVLFGLDRTTRPRLLTWALRDEDIPGTVARATHVGLGAVQPGTRRTPAGGTLSWTLTDPRALPLGGTVPFLIGWGDTPHPAASAPGGAELVELRIGHPEPERVRDALGVLRVEVEIDPAPTVGLVATIRCPRGIVELR